jgi:hypothetical protein
LTGTALDLAVAKAVRADKLSLWEDRSITAAYAGTLYCGHWEPSSDWEQCGVLIDRYRVAFVLHGDEIVAVTGRDDMSGAAGGLNHKVAACRAVVIAELGEEIEIPEELL